MEITSVQLDESLSVKTQELFLFQLIDRVLIHIMCFGEGTIKHKMQKNLNFHQSFGQSALSSTIYVVGTRWWVGAGGGSTPALVVLKTDVWNEWEE